MKSPPLSSGGSYVVTLRQPPDDGRPTSNKTTYQRSVRHGQRMHKKRMKEVKSSVDCSPPRTWNKRRGKVDRKALQERRAKEDLLARDNERLLAKLVRIKSQPGGVDSTNTAYKYSRSLNIDGRRAELSRITYENKMLLKRLNRVKPSFSVREWDRDFVKAQKLSVRVSEFRTLVSVAPGSASPSGSVRIVGMRPSTTRPRMRGESHRRGRALRNAGVNSTLPVFVIPTAGEVDGAPDGGAVKRAATASARTRATASERPTATTRSSGPTSDF